MRYGKNEYVEKSRTEGEDMIRAGEQWESKNKEEQWEDCRQQQGQEEEERTRRENQEKERQRQETKEAQATYLQRIQEEARTQIKKEQDNRRTAVTKAGQLMTQAAGILTGDNGNGKIGKGERAKNKEA
jgi:hypothetical protein